MTIARAPFTLLIRGMASSEFQGVGFPLQGKRTDAFNHSKAVAEALPSLSWVVYSGPGCGT